MAKQARSETTRAALIDAAFELFGDKGFAAASTREIAARAGTNIASITYHFGGKAGLRIACAETIVSYMLKQRTAPDAMPVPQVAQATETEFEFFILRQADLLLSSHQAQVMIRFMFRELYEQSDVFNHVYENFFGPIFTHIITLWAKATGMSLEEAGSDVNKIRIFSVIAQIAYFRIGQPVVSRHLGWGDYERSEVDQILRVLQSNIRLLIASHRNTQ